MAQKKITDLQLRADFDDTCNIPVDDAVQTWRSTGAQFLAFIKTALKPVVESGTTTDTVNAATDLYLADTSGGAWTLTLPAATSEKVIRIKKTTADFNALTIARAGSDTISDLSTGLTSTALHTLGEEIELVPNGVSAWIVTNRKIPSFHTSYTPTLTNFGNGTAVTFRWIRDGRRMRIIGTLQVGSSLPTGTYTFTAPSGIAPLTSEMPPADTVSGPTIFWAGKCFFNQNASGIMRDIGQVGWATATSIFNMLSDDFWKDTVPVTAAQNDKVTVDLSFPVTGWNA